MENKEIVCKRPYSLGKRLEQSDGKRLAVIAAARAQLEAGGYLNLTMDSLARESGVTRQTVHNLFKTKAGVLEALFDQLAVEGGMARMAEVMRDGMGQDGMGQADAGVILNGFVRVFTDFWAKERLLIRRIHGIAALNPEAGPEFGAAVEARNQRRRMAAARVVARLGQMRGGADAVQAGRDGAALYAMTSFEFFDAVAQGLGDVQEAAGMVAALVRTALRAPSF